MMKIAIWGYGKYGRRMFDSLTRFCSEEYEVVRVYDVNYRSLVSTEGKLRLPIHNPEELREILNYIDLYIHASDYEIEGSNSRQSIGIQKNCQ